MQPRTRTRGADHLSQVSERSGHASIVITLDTYCHVPPSLQEGAARDLDAWLASRARAAGGQRVLASIREQLLRRRESRKSVRVEP